MTLEAEVDRDVCIGSGGCVFLAPGAFDLDDDGIAVAVDPSAASEDELLTAARRCPTRAITIRRDGQALK